ncbi:MAG: MarR family transcriptional regulator [Pseudobacteriovorax sp.]|nr:MarR family transcriptional regulator [Pseudobacteriovorax sp.]
MSQNDVVDLAMDQWRQEEPSLDPSPMGITSRLFQIQAKSEKLFRQYLMSFEIGIHEFDVLATLKRSGPPFRLSPTQLYKSSMLTSGAMTNRIDRLEKQRLVLRKKDPQDRRAQFVELSAKGHELISGIIPDYFQQLSHLLSPLTEFEQTQLAILLRKLNLGIKWEA